LEGIGIRGGCFVMRLDIGSLSASRGGPGGEVRNRGVVFEGFGGGWI